MLGGKRILAIIPARAGSRRLKGKNIKPLLGKPLLAWTIEQAQQACLIDRLILSSEDAATINIARKYACEVPFKRPANLAQDDTPGIMPVLHALEHLPGYDYVMLLQPTSPLRSSIDIDECIKYCIARQLQIMCFRIYFARAS